MYMCRHWYSGLCFVSDQQAHAEKAQLAHLRIQRVVPSQASRGRILFWVCFPCTFQQTSRHSTSCGTGVSIHVSAAMCECRILAHPTPQDRSWLFMAESRLASTVRDTHSRRFLVAILTSFPLQYRFPSFFCSLSFAR